MAMSPIEDGLRPSPSGDTRESADRVFDGLVAARESEDWDEVVRIVETQWHLLANHRFTDLVTFMQELPEAAVSGSAMVCAARGTLLGVYGSLNPEQSVLPVMRADRDTLARSPEALDVLVSVTGRAMLNREMAAYGASAELLRDLIDFARAAAIAPPDVIHPHLPILRLQWALSLQLAGQRMRLSPNCGCPTTMPLRTGVVS